MPAACRPPKIFSNHWKTAEKFFQSLEKPPGIFQPLEFFFQSLENFPAAQTGGAGVPPAKQDNESTVASWTG
ncbi:MAG: hypothetical protein IKO01_03655 [Kiritimatiellae bacterium]|nr:hypothetical protein [Kiritimatiellia bacterium]